MSRTLAVLPHPDDEVFVAGSLRLWGAQIVCATRGEAGRDAAGSLEGDALGEHRWGELQASCAALGLDPPVGLDLPDGALEAAAVAERLRERLGEDLGGAERVVTLGPDGVYGHRDHLAVTAAVLEVADVVHLAVFPPGLFHPLWRGLRRAGFAGVVPGMHPGSFGSEEADVAVPVEARWREVAAACHRSQLRGAPRDFLMPGLLDGLGDVDRYVLRRSAP